ncbi:MAG TPA: penicillin-binding protein 2 [Kofleriaceae bacterium]|nr:penicillin-binding protein 2 [Kofleriaceae bacterium]
MLIRSAPGSGPAVPELHHRLRWLVIVMIVVFLALAARLWQLQIVNGDDNLAQARANVVKRRPIASMRGRILDRDGRPLADNRAAYDIYVDPRHFDQVGPELVRLLGLSEEDTAIMEDKMAEARERRATGPQPVLEGQTQELAGAVLEATYALPGVEVRRELHRDYPQGELAAHVIGYMNKLTDKELHKARQDGTDYEEHELIGRDGLERRMENRLRGHKGEQPYVVNARGQQIEGAEADRLLAGERSVAPVAGQDVILTIDLDLQKIAERAVKYEPAAAVVVVEVATGRILALVSRPSFDPNVMTGKLTRARKAELDADPRDPFVDKALGQHYPPGSLFKIVTAAAALEDGLINGSELQHCPGYYERSNQTFRCTAAHGFVDLQGAIQQSCNVYFWKLAEQVGLDRMAEVAADFGFGKATGLGLNGDLPGRMPDKAWYRQRGEFKIGNTLNAATGQGDVEVTVMQLAMAYAAIANGGTLWVPQLIRRVQTRARPPVVVVDNPPMGRKISVSPETLEILRAGMDKVVNEVGGTAFEHGHSDIVHIAGKTGTAQVRKGKNKVVEFKGWHPYRDHAWFAGFAPADAPEIAITVLIEHGGAGGKVAAPVAKEILEKYFTVVKPAHEKQAATP